MKKYFLIGFVFFFGFFACALSFAEDYIEVKGRGVMSVKIEKEDATSITFTDPNGITQTVPRSQITMIEKGSPSSQAASPKNPFFSTPAAPAPVSASRPIVIPSRMSGATIADIKQALAERAKNRALNTDPTTKVNLWIEGVYMTQALFFIPDAESFGKTVMDTIERAQKKQGSSSYGITALVLGIVGVLSLIVSGFMVIINSFRCGARWGWLILTNGIVNMMAVHFGETMIFISHIWLLLIMYFFLTRFQVMRRPMIFSTISLILVLSAFVVARIGFVSV